jgi:hypothetical protein
MGPEFYLEDDVALDGFGADEDEYDSYEGSIWVLDEESLA